MNIFSFAEMKEHKKKISVVTCYDYSFAKLVAQSKVDAILVGDSLAMTMYGHSSTLPVSTATMAKHIRAVVRGAPEKFIIGDMPFMSFRKSRSRNMTAVEILMKAGAHAVKLEGVDGNERLIRHVVDSGVPVMGHLGLTPQSVHALGGYKVQGRNEVARNKIIDQAQRLQDAGCFSLVLECVPSSLAKLITDKLHIPTIGIGAGIHTDGQVLVLQDLLGMNVDFKPKFVRQFADLKQTVVQAFDAYQAEVAAGTFPAKTETFE